MGKLGQQQFHARMLWIWTDRSNPDPDPDQTDPILFETLKIDAFWWARGCSSSLVDVIIHQRQSSPPLPPTFHQISLISLFSGAQSLSYPNTVPTSILPVPIQYCSCILFPATWRPHISPKWWWSNHKKLEKLTWCNSQWITIYTIKHI